MSDTKAWPLVPVDPECVPEGYEAVRVGFAESGEHSISMKGGSSYYWIKGCPNDGIIRLIIRPIPKPIKLPVFIVPPGWWVARDDEDRTWIYRDKPAKTSSSFLNDKTTTYRVPPPIAAQLPVEYLALPWDQSLMQQTEGM